MKNEWSELIDLLRGAGALFRDGLSDDELLRAEETYGFKFPPDLRNFLMVAILSPDIYDPRLNPLYRDVLAHYGVTALPCKVRDPDRKGKVEPGVGHTQKAPLKGKRFERLEEAQVISGSLGRTLGCRVRSNCAWSDLVVSRAGSRSIPREHHPTI